LQDSLKPSAGEWLKKNALYILILLFLILRLWILCSGAFMWNDEELYNGTITKEILAGLNLPLFDYQYTPHNGGTIIVGILAIPFFILFGDSYFSLKLVALGFSLLTLVILFTILKSYLDLRYAVLASLLFIFSPPLFTQSTLISWGAHTEAIALSFLNILIFFKIFFSQEGYYFKEVKRSYPLIFLSGLSAGFSLYFAYINFYSILLCFFFWFVLDRLFFFKKTFLIYVGGFIIGFSPWIYYNITHSFTGIDILRLYSPATSRRVPVIGKASKFLSSDILILFNFPGLKSKVIYYIPFLCYFFLCFVFLTLLWRNRDSVAKIFKAIIPLKGFSLTPDCISKEAFFLFAPILFSLVFFFSNVTIYPGSDKPFLTYRYLTHLYPFIFIILAIYFSKSFKGKKGIYGLVLKFIFLGFLIIGFLGNIKIPSNDYKIRYSDLDGFSYRRLGWTIPNKFGHDFAKYIELGQRIEPHFRHEYFDGLGFSIGGKGIIWKKGFEKFLNLNQLIEKLDERYKSYYYQGVGYSVGFNSIYNDKQCIKDLRRIEKKYRSYAFIGMAMAIYKNETRQTDIPSLIKSIPPEYRKYFYPVLGRYIYHHKWSIRDSIEYINQLGLGSDEQLDVYRGIGADIFLNSYYTLDRLNKEAEIIPREQRTAFYEGVGATIGFLYRKRLDKLSGLLKRCNINIMEKRNIYRGIGRYLAEEYGFNLPLCFKSFEKIDIEFKKNCYEGLESQVNWRFSDNKITIDNLLKEVANSSTHFIKS